VKLQGYYIEKNPQKIEKFIEESLLIDVKFSSVNVHYNLLSPSLKLYDLTIFQSAHNNKHFNNDLHFNSASISLNLLKSLLFFKPNIKYINLDGFKTSINRSKDKNLSIGSLKISPSTQDNEPILPLWLLNLKSFSLTNTQLIINDEIMGIKDHKLDDINIKFTNKNEWIHSLSISVKNPQEKSKSIPVLFDQINFTSLLRGSSYNLNEWAGKWFLDIKNLHYNNSDSFSKFTKNNLDINIIKGIFSGKLWGSISQSSFSELIGQIQVKKLKLQRDKNNKILEINQLSTLFRLNENKHFLQSSQQQKLQIKNWLVSFYQFDLTTPIHELNKSSVFLPYSNIKFLKKPKLIEISSNIHSLPLDGLDDILNFIDPDISQSYQQIQPKGSLTHIGSNFTVESEQIKNLKFSSKLNNISANSWRDIPQFNNLSGTLWINDKQGIINIDSSDFKVDLQPLFRHKWQFDQLISQISWQHIGSQLWLNADNSIIKNNHLNINGNFQFWLNQKEKSSPLMLINAYFDHVDASYVPIYLPANAFSQGLTDWLDDAFVAAHVPDGGILFRGRLDQFPYSQQKGLMEITFHSQDMLLNYYNGWPKFRNVKSEIQFTETGMFIDVENVQLYDSYSHDTQVVLNDYLTSDIKIHSKIKSNAIDAFNYLQNTDILNKKYIEKLTSKGNVDIDLFLEIPTDEKPTKSIAKVDLKKLLFTPEWLAPLRVENVKGKLTINNGNISSQLLSAQLHSEKLNQEPIQVKINTLNKKDQDISQINISGSISTDIIKASGYIPDSMDYLFSYLKGTTAYNAKLLLSYNNGQLIPDLLIQSKLRGIDSLLPKPLNKNNNQEKQLTLSYKENSINKSLQLNYSNILNYCNQSKISEPSIIKTHINFFASSCLLPIEPLISISGKLDLSNYVQWQSIISKHDQTKPSSNKKPDIEFDFQEVILPSDILEYSSIDTDKESSTNNEPSTNKKSSTNKEPSTDITDKVASMDNKSSIKRVPTLDDKLLSNEDVNYKDYPEFKSINGNIENLIIDKTTLGKLSISSHSETNKLIYDSINLHGEQINLELKGYTETNESKSITLINGTVDLIDTGNFLKKINYYNGLELANSHFEGYLKWHGPIMAFSSKNLFGKIKYQFENGNLTEVNPGIGKIIELINLNDIKQRFNFGFDELSRLGLKFNNIEGSLLFNQVNLYTRDIKLDSNTAKIKANGYVNIDKKTCQHLLIVTPNISSGLPYAGLAIGGPAGAALGYIGQKFLGKEFNKISQYKYNISGLCKDPVIINKTLSNQSTLN